MKEIILRISYFRTRAGLSARELSLRIGKHPSYISKLESRDFNLPVSALMEIIAALGIGVAEFFSDNYQTYRKDTELLNFFKNLKPEHKESLICILKK